MKKICNLIYGILFILGNIVVKFLIFGNKEIWFNNMPGPRRNYYYGFKDFIEVSVFKMIPFIIVGGLLTGIYELILFKKNIFNKKRDTIIPIIIYIITNIILLCLFVSQCKICC